MATLNERIRRAIQSDHDAQRALERLGKARCDPDTLISKIENVVSAYGSAGVQASLEKRKKAAGLPGHLLPELRGTFADLPKRLQGLADRIEKINESPVSPVRFSARFMGKDEAGSWVPRYRVPGEAESVLRADPIFRVVAASGDSLPRLLRAYAAVVAAVSRAVPGLIPKDSFEQIATDFEVDLLNYVKETTGGFHWSDVNNILAAGLSALGKYAPAKRDFFDPTTLRMRYHSASKHPGFFGQR